MSTIFKKSIGATLLMALPLSATVAADLYGGGATYPAVPYVGSVAVGTTTRRAVTATMPGSGSPTVTATANSILGAYATFSGGADRVSYCLTGSGTGKTTQIGSLAANGACNPTLVGFGSTNLRPNFIGTDSPYSTSEYSSFVSNAGTSKRAVVQVPSLVGTIVLPFRNSNITGNVTLTAADVCNIFVGNYTNWNQIPNLGLPSKALRVVSRSDGSGTTFAFSNYAARACNQANGGPIPPASGSNARITTNQSYGLTGLRVDLTASGNPNLVSTVLNTEGAIGYSDPGDVFASSGAKWVLVNGANPQTFTSPPVSSLLTGQGISGVNATTGLPSTASVSSAVPAALTLVNPSFAVTSGYPIVAFTYLAAYARGNDDSDVGGNVDAASSLQNLFFCVHNTIPGCRPNTLPAGYAYVNLSTTARGTVENAIAEISN